MTSLFKYLLILETRRKEAEFRLSRGDEDEANEDKWQSRARPRRILLTIKHYPGARGLSASFGRRAQLHKDLTLRRKGENVRDAGGIH